MASEIRVNKINSRTGVGTITLSPTGVDFTGIATVATLKATTGIVTTLSVTGTTTLNGNLDLQDNDKILVGTGDDLEIYHDGTDTWVDNTQGDLYLRTSGSGDDIIIRSADDVLIQSQASEASVICRGDGQVEIYHNNDKKLETTGVGASVTGTFNVGTGTSITSSSLIVNDVQYPTAGPLSNRNLIHNGAMNVAQYGTSGTANGFNCIDRFGRDVNGGTGTFTDSQQTLTSGSPYDEGFRKFYRAASSSASTAGTGSYLQVRYKAEAQDIANSGWNYTDSSSYVTLSFWVRASVTQTYGFGVQTHDGTSYAYNKNFALTANTWTKIEQKIPGNSNLQFDNDANKGLTIKFWPHLGSTYNGATDDTWNTQASNNLGSSIGTDWWTASSATFDLTGVQLEVGEKATPFEHRSYSDELARCQRYFYKITGNTSDQVSLGIAYCYAATNGDEHVRLTVHFPTTMRADVAYSSNNLRGLISGSTEITSNSSSGLDESIYSCGIDVGFTSSSLSVYDAIQVRLKNATDAYVQFSAEL